MICEHCRLATFGGFHSPGFCVDWLEAEKPADVDPPKPQPIRGQLAVCANTGCLHPTGPGRVMCSPCTRTAKTKAAS